MRSRSLPMRPLSSAPLSAPHHRPAATSSISTTRPPAPTCQSPCTSTSAPPSTRSSECPLSACACPPPRRRRCGRWPALRRRAAAGPAPCIRACRASPIEPSPSTCPPPPPIQSQRAVGPHPHAVELGGQRPLAARVRRGSGGGGRSGSRRQLRCVLRPPPLPCTAICLSSSACHPSVVWSVSLQQRRGTGALWGQRRTRNGECVCVSVWASPPVVDKRCGAQAVCELSS